MSCLAALFIVFLSRMGTTTEWGEHLTFCWASLSPPLKYYDVFMVVKGIGSELIWKMKRALHLSLGTADMFNKTYNRMQKDVRYNKSCMHAFRIDDEHNISCFVRTRWDMLNFRENVMDFSKRISSKLRNCMFRKLEKINLHEFNFWLSVKIWIREYRNVKTKYVLSSSHI